MEYIINLLKEDGWRRLNPKPLLYVGFHEKIDGNYMVVTSSDSVFLVSHIGDDVQQRQFALNELGNLAGGGPILLNQVKTKKFFDTFASV